MSEASTFQDAAPRAPSAVPEPAAFFDAHFHWWDLEQRPNLAVEGMIKHFGPSAYLSEMLPSCEHAGFTFGGGVVVESTISTMEGMPNAPLSAESESTAIAKWITTTKQIQPGLKFRFVAFANLCDSTQEFETHLLKHRCILGVSLCGVRMILNYDADDASKCWPGISHDALLSSAFRANFALLSQHNLSFDLQCNPKQLASAAELCKSSPTAKVCLNHIGLPKFDPYFINTSESVNGTPTGDDTSVNFNDQSNNNNINNNSSQSDETSSTTHDMSGIAELVLNAAGVQALDGWKKGLKALADAGPHVCVKISMLGYAVSNWWTFEATTNGRQKLMNELISYVVSTFGPKRCMVGSNWPVDDEPKREHMNMLKALIASLGLSQEQIEMIWSKNAERFYAIE